jgi:5'-nucleotidase
VSNDDGVGAPGIDSLVQALRAEPNVEVTVVAPADNKSGSGSSTSSGATATNATTLSGFPATAVNGFPADAVNYGLDSVVKDKPDVVITGTNQGQNIGPFVDVSGTVGAARAGLGDPVDFAAATKQAIEWLREHRDALLAGGPAPTTVDNLNAPTCSAGEVRGLAEVPADPTAPNDQALAKVDCTSTVAQPSTDVAAFNAGFATLSHVPLTPATG